MRERTKVSWDQTGYSYSVYQSGFSGLVLTDSGSGVHNYVKSYEYMLDEGHGHRAYNPVFHVKYRGEPRMKSGIYYGMLTENPADIFQVVSSQVMGLTDLPTLLSAMPVVPADKIEELAYQAFMKASTQVSEDASLPNFLIELREVKDLIPKIQGFLKTISGGFLNWQFGWKPIISDIRAFLKSAETVRNRIKYLKSIYEKPTPLHFGVSNFFQPEITPRDTQNARLSAHQLATVWEDFGLTSEVRLTSYRCEWNSTIVVYSTVTGLDAADAFLHGMLANLGFLNGAKIVWNALPWSWLIEWFVNLDRFLDSYMDKPFKGEIRVLSSGTSLKEVALLEVGNYWVTDPAILYDANAETDWIPNCTYFLEKYTRSTGLPVSSSLFKDGSLTTQQWAILLALLDQRR